jgi:hypothetical protein
MYAIFLDPNDPTQAYRSNYHTNWKQYYKSPFGCSQHSTNNYVDAVKVDFDRLFKEHQAKLVYAQNSFWNGRRWEPVSVKVDGVVAADNELYKVFVTYTDSTGFDHEVDVTYS